MTEVYSDLNIRVEHENLLFRNLLRQQIDPFIILPISDWNDAIIIGDIYSF